MKLVAQVSSSMSRSEEPDSTASRIFTTCEVEPLAETVEKFSVDGMICKLFMNPDTLIG